MNWISIALRGAASIARVVNIYEVTDLRVPSTKYRIKVLERGLGEFLALPNMCVKTRGGEPDWTAGLGRTETEALQDAVHRVDDSLRGAGQLTEEDLAWSDPRDF